MKYVIIDCLHTPTGRAFYMVVDDVYYKDHGKFWTYQSAESHINYLKEKL
ncbi:MAG: hypothetical protein IAE63_00030 [Alphaproteobacteria bacterium]|nr:hypothetical protein [Alphaproteobacteria bacterium]